MILVLELNNYFETWTSVNHLGNVLLDLRNDRVEERSHVLAKEQSSVMIVLGPTHGLTYLVHLIGRSGMGESCVPKTTMS